jgi:selenocysteine-specific elongation factor
MQVIATAGHVDHGKSALLRALTGMEPDRWAEERRRGMTIDLGFAWLRLPSGESLAFVDVPGHAKFVPNMLAGVGPVPAVLFVVAADGGWMPQSAEHLAAIDALGISRGILAVTRSDLADPGPSMRQALGIIGRSSLGQVRAVAVSAVTGAGLPELTGELATLASGLPAPDPGAAVRLWVDRAFTITGSGTVVTGTLPAGTLHRGDELLLTPSLRPLRIRGLQTLGEPVAQIAGVARVALNLRGIEAGDLARGMALVRAGQWTLTTLIDVRITRPTSGGGTEWSSPPPGVTVHAGSARTPARIRMLAGPGAGTGGGPVLARLTLRDPLPLQVGERVLLRDPGAAARGVHGGDGDGWPGLAGATVLDVVPPPLRRRGAAAASAAELASWPDRPAAAQILRRHKLLSTAALTGMGLTDLPEPVVPGWLADPAHLAALARQLARVVAAHAAGKPLAPGMPVDAVCAALGLPDRRLVPALLTAPLRMRDGLISADPGTAADELPAQVAAAVAAIMADLKASPFSAPDAARLAELGLDRKAVAAAARRGALLRISDQVVLGAGADVRAAQVLADLPQPFTAAQAREALGTTRRTLIPLLEYLDRAGLTRRLPDDRREVRPGADR